MALHACIAGQGWRYGRSKSGSRPDAAAKKLRQIAMAAVCCLAYRGLLSSKTRTSVPFSRACVLGGIALRSAASLSEPL